MAPRNGLLSLNFDQEASGPLSIGNGALLQRHVEEAESRIQRGQRNVDHQRKGVSDLERDNDDATIAKRLLAMLEKALVIHIADREPADQTGGATAALTC